MIAGINRTPRNAIVLAICLAFFAVGNSAGKTLPDGTYAVTVTGTSVGGTSAALPFTVTGMATGVQSQANGLQLQLGALSVPFSAVKTVGK